MIELLVKGVLSYLLGSVIGSLVIGRLRGGVDIRTLGSGNAGATNALRTQSRAFALAVLAIDIAKGWIATAVIAPAHWAAIPPASPELGAWCVPLCALAVILGHVYPLCFGFRGGKGFATLVGAVLGIHPWLLVPMLLAWLLTVILFGFVGLASILATAALAGAIALGEGMARAPLVAFGVLMVLLISFTHRSNIARMCSGNESRAKRLWLLGTRRGPG